MFRNIGLMVACSALVASGLARPARPDDDAQKALDDLEGREARYRQRLIEQDAEVAKRKKEFEAQQMVKRLADEARSADNQRLAAEKRQRRRAKRIKENGHG